VADDVFDGRTAKRTPVCPLHDTLTAMTAGIALDSNGLPHGLRDLLSSLAADDEPGFAVGIYSSGTLAGVATAGCAISEHAVPITEHTVFEIASASKHITAACMLLLATDGAIDLDDDIRGKLPELALRQPVTLRQCLTHSAGLRDYLSLCDVAGIPLAGIGEGRAMDLIAGQRDLDFTPGSAFSYSNTGYVLAAALVRRITGESLAEFASERVFGPLGMNATAFRDDVGVPVPRLAGGYLAVPAGFRRADVTENVVGDGGCVTSLVDLAGWHGFMAGGAVLGTDIRDSLLAGEVLAAGPASGYALGLAAVDVGGEAGWWHSGSWAGYRSAVIYLPGLGAGVSVLANRNDRYASHIAAAAARALVTGEDVRAGYAAAAGTPAPADRAAAAAADTAGLWHAPALDLFAEFQPRDGQIVAPEQDGEQVYLLGTDGRWHGTGTASGGTYAWRGDALVAGWGLSAGLEDRYVRADPARPGPSDPCLASGYFVNEEVRAYANIQPEESSAAEITIGLAAPRALVPAGPGVWRAPTGGALTVRLADDGDSLLISVPGAHHVAFSPAADPGALAVPRGLRASLWPAGHTSV
jgi:CubicO group peptidase (beta-lactamase class C family)